MKSVRALVNDGKCKLGFLINLKLRTVNIVN